jgi:hypothetical protein
LKARIKILLKQQQTCDELKQLQARHEAKARQRSEKEFEGKSYRKKNSAAWKSRLWEACT